MIARICIRDVHKIKYENYFVKFYGSNHVLTTENKWNVVEACRARIKIELSF